MSQSQLVSLVKYFLLIASTVTETASDASDGEINDNSETPEEEFKKEVETEVEEMPPIVDEKSGKEVDEK